MRPQSAQHSQTVLFNQLSGHYYTLTHEGKQLRVNKRGDLATKFTNGFTGFYNFKERKHRSIRDKALMYTEPKLDYDKENGFLSPVGTKFVGYAQSPYNLKGEILEFLGGVSFKETLEKKNQSKSMKVDDFKVSLNGNSLTVNKQMTVNKFKSVKLFRKNNTNELNFELIKDKPSQKGSQQGWCNLLAKRQQSSSPKFNKSIILDAGQNYTSSQTHKRIKSTNASSAPSLHRSTNPHSSMHHKTYFEQSLSNIQRTQNPNYLHSDFNYSEFGANTFNQSSVKGKCYKRSCHDARYVPKRRYAKGRKDDNTVGIGEHKVGLDEERKEKELIERLREDLKIYQPVLVLPQVKNEQEKKPNDKDKGKKPVVQNNKK